jgi:hypothetical protein
VRTGSIDDRNRGLDAGEEEGGTGTTARGPAGRADRMRSRPGVARRDRSRETGSSPSSDHPGVVEATNDASVRRRRPCANQRKVTSGAAPSGLGGPKRMAERSSPPWLERGESCESALSIWGRQIRIVKYDPLFNSDLDTINT